MTATAVDWIDVFTLKSYRDVVIDSLAFCVENKGILFYGSANNYVNNEGLVAIEIVDNPLIDVLKKASITKYNQN